MAIERHEVGPIMSQIVVHGDTVYLSGQVAGDATADVKGQTQQILDKIDAHLASVGSDKSKVLSASIWLTDISTWADMNEVWSAWVDPANPPARATVESNLAAPQYTVEIMVIAAK
jgi:enamine deaminase RidA (YjgF/YER057c/UK114 family)